MGHVVALNENNPNISHESEVQRQHIRVKITATVKFNGKTYKTSNLSAGGFSLVGVEQPPVIGREEEVKMIFKFSSFVMAADIKATPVYYNAEHKIAGFKMAEVGKRETSLINYILKSYLSGNIVTENDLLNVVARDNYTKPRKEVVQTEEGTNWRRFVPMTLITVTCAAAMFLFFGNVYETAAIVKSYMGVVEGSTFTVRAPKNGNYESLLPEGSARVTKDQAIGVMRNNTSSVGPVESASELTPSDIVIKSPCDCLIAKTEAHNGEFYVAGSPLLELMPANGNVWVEAALRPEQVYRIQLQDDARIKIVGEATFIEGNVTEFLAPEKNDELSRVRIKTRTPIMPQMLGRVAYVEFVVN